MSKGQATQAKGPGLPPVPREPKAALAALVFVVAIVMIVAFMVADVPDNARAGFLALGFALGLSSGSYLLVAAATAIAEYVRDLVKTLVSGLMTRTTTVVPESVIAGDKALSEAGCDALYLDRGTAMNDIADACLAHISDDNESRPLMLMGTSLRQFLHTDGLQFKNAYLNKLIQNAISQRPAGRPLTIIGFVLDPGNAEDAAASSEAKRREQLEFKETTLPDIRESISRFSDLPGPGGRHLGKYNFRPNAFLVVTGACAFEERYAGFPSEDRVGECFGDELPVVRWRRDSKGYRRVQQELFDYCRSDEVTWVQGGRPNVQPPPGNQ
jgi:hypothetical protein